VLSWSKCAINKRCKKLGKKLKAAKRAGQDGAARELKRKRVKLGCKRVGL
jgi:hypothetical protein